MLGEESGRPGGVGVERIVVEEQHPAGIHREAVGDLGEDRRVRLHQAEVEGEEGVVEHLENGPAVNLVFPVQDVGIAEAADGQQALHLGEQV